MIDSKNEKDAWEKSNVMMGSHQLIFGSRYSEAFRKDPLKFIALLSKYKFAAKMSPKNARVLELDCHSGIGASILAEQAVSYTGVDLDPLEIKIAQTNLNFSKFTFISDAYLGKAFGSFESVISIDSIQYISPDLEGDYFKTILKNLSSNGTCIIGTPNALRSCLIFTNMYSQQRLLSVIRRYFHVVLPFGMSNEIVHNGHESCDYLICVACDKKESYV